MQIAQSVPGFDAQIRGDPSAGLGVDGQGGGVVARAVERDHPQPDQVLVQGVLGGRSGERSEDRVMSSQSQFGAEQVG